MDTHPAATKGRTSCGRVGATVRVMSVLMMLHLGSVVAVVWTEMGHDRFGTMGSAVRAYQNLAGTMRDYSFFAPAVASDIKAVFVLENEAGTQSTLVQFATDNPEVALRYDSLIAACMRDERGRDFFAQSWAASLLGTRPEAARVLVMVKSLYVPTMADYRAGQRPTWKLLYAGEFGRRSGVVTP